MFATSPKDIRAYRPASLQKGNVFLHCPGQGRFPASGELRLQTDHLVQAHQTGQDKQHDQLIATFPQAAMRRLPQSERALDDERKPCSTFMRMLAFIRSVCKAI